MRSLFRGKRDSTELGRGHLLVQEDPPETKGFSFEILGKDVVSECVDAVIKAMPQVRWNREGLESRLLAPNALTIIARLEGALAGLISGTVMTPSLPPSIGFMAIFDSNSGAKGLGGYMIDEFIEEIQKRVPKAPCVDVSLPNLDTGSIALYSLKGFVVNGFIKNEIKSRLGEGTHDLVHLRRWLAKAHPKSVV